MSDKVRESNLILTSVPSDVDIRRILKTPLVVFPGWQEMRRPRCDCSMSVCMGWITAIVPTSSNTGLPKCVKIVKGGHYVARTGWRTPNEVATTLLWNPSSSYSIASEEYFRRYVQICGVPHIDGLLFNLRTMGNGSHVEFFAASEDAARKRAAKKGRAYQMEPGWMQEMYLSQNGLCALSGLPMYRRDGKLCQLIPVPDRKDSNGGYTPDNVRLLRHGVNMARKDTPDQDFIEMCRAVAGHSHQPQIT